LTQFQYDALNRKTVTIDAATNRVSTLFDAVGNATQMTDARGNSTQFLYDADNRQTVTIDAATFRTTTLFDRVGNATQMTDARGNALGCATGVPGVRPCRLLRLSSGKHATKHFHETGHPVMRSVMPGDTWTWCYVHEVDGGLGQVASGS
jgi:YD repeat-containing protein